MAFTVAVSGKGGTGKSTIAALIVSELIASKAGSVLAVDADPNYNLGLLLGQEVIETVADIREYNIISHSAITPPPPIYRIKMHIFNSSIEEHFS